MPCLSNVRTHRGYIAADSEDVSPGKISDPTRLRKNSAGILPYANLQVGITSVGGDHSFAEKKIAANYFCLFPNTMVNVYS